MFPNHKSFVAITVQLAHEGKLLVMTLNIIEVEKVCQDLGMYSDQ
jgi:hypothetical protein